MSSAGWKCWAGKMNSRPQSVIGSNRGHSLCVCIPCWYVFSSLATAFLLIANAAVILAKNSPDRVLHKKQPKNHVKRITVRHGVRREGQIHEHARYAEMQYPRQPPAVCLGHAPCNEVPLLVDALQAD